MSISEKLTAEQLQEILLTMYQKGNETESMKLLEAIEEIRNQFLGVIDTNENT